MSFNAALQRLASEDAALHRIVSEVNHLVKPSSALRAPQIVDRVERQLRHRPGLRGDGEP
jgi:hypothetical protein